MYIPANTVKTYTGKYPSGSGTLPADISIYGSSPHGHKVNTSMLVYGYRASPVDTIPLIRIPKWDFAWQGAYTHKKMVKIPQDTSWGRTHVYETYCSIIPIIRSNPPQLVTAGTSTTNEMLFDSFEWMYLSGRR